MDRNIPGKILDTVWKLEKIAIDFHGKKILWGKFKKDFTVILLELVGILINCEMLNQEKGG